MEYIGDLQLHLVERGKFVLYWTTSQHKFTCWPIAGHPPWQDQPGLLQEWQHRAVPGWKPGKWHRFHMRQEAGQAVRSSLPASVFLAHLLCGHSGKCLGRARLLQIPLQEEHDGSVPAAPGPCGPAPPLHPSLLGQGCLWWLDLQELHVQSRQQYV